MFVVYHVCCALCSSSNPTARASLIIATELFGVGLAEGEREHLGKLFEGARNTRRSISQKHTSSIH